MKKIFAPLAAIVMAVSLSSFKISDGNCNPYYPIKQGATREMISYNTSGKQTGRVVQIITGVTTNGNTMTINAKSDTYDNKDKQASSVNFSVKCDGGVFYFNLAGLAGPEQQRGNTQMTVTGDFVDMPGNPSNGQQLKGGTMTITLTGQVPPGMGSIVSTISNRQVDSASVIRTTPAGTFNCVRISYDITTKTIFSIHSHIVEWYSTNVGMVRMERYNEKGKMEGYSVLTKLSGN